MKLKIPLAVAAIYVGAAAWTAADFEAGLSREYRLQRIDRLDVCFQDSWFAHAAGMRAAQAQRAARQWMGWAFELPAQLPVPLAALAFGILGSVGGMIWTQLRARRLAARATVAGTMVGGAAGLGGFGALTLLARLVEYYPSGLTVLLPLALGLLAGGLAQHFWART